MKSRKNFGRYQIFAVRKLDRSVIGSISNFDPAAAFFTRRGLSVPETRIGRIVLMNRVVSTCDSTIRGARIAARRFENHWRLAGVPVLIFNSEKNVFVK